jgi:hypothetical protein
LQALVTLNDPVYEEAAQALARRVVKDTATKPSGESTGDRVLDARLVYETRLVLSRDPTAYELAQLRAFYKDAMKMPQPALVNASMNLSPESPVRKGAGSELEALTAVGSILFNLDAALVR